MAVEVVVFGDGQCVEGPVGYLRGLADNRNRLDIILQAEERHWLKSGNLDQSSVTGELRDRFLYDNRWDCDVCRVYKEHKEGNRIIGGFRSHRFDDTIDEAGDVIGDVCECRKMWVTGVKESEAERESGALKRAIRRSAAKAGADHVSVPIFTSHRVVLTTRPLVEGRSELLAEHHKHTDFATVRSSHGSSVDDRREIFDILMPYRWQFETGGGISSSRGFLLPARKIDGYEAHVKGAGLRCWHLHNTKGHAQKCALWLNLDKPPSSGRWYVRATSEWHQCGKTAVFGDELIKLAAECGIRSGPNPKYEVINIVLEPMVWNDPRFVEFRLRAGWEPPNDKFQPPPFEMEFRLVARHGKVIGRAVKWWQKET